MDWNVRRWTACEGWDGSKDRKAFILTSSFLYEATSLAILLVLYREERCLRIRASVERWTTTILFIILHLLSIPPFYHALAPNVDIGSCRPWYLFFYILLILATVSPFMKILADWVDRTRYAQKRLLPITTTDEQSDDQMMVPLYSYIIFSQLVFYPMAITVSLAVHTMDYFNIYATGYDTIAFVLKMNWSFFWDIDYRGRFEDGVAVSPMHPLLSAAITYELISVIVCLYFLRRGSARVRVSFASGAGIAIFLIMHCFAAFPFMNAVTSGSFQSPYRPFAYTFYLIICGLSVSQAEHMLRSWMKLSYFPNDVIIKESLLPTKAEKQPIDEPTIPLCAIVTSWQMAFYPLALIISIVVRALDYTNVYGTVYDYFFPSALF